MNTLQLKRTNKNQNQLQYLLSDGEFLLVKDASANNPQDPEENITYVFAGDGQTTINGLYNNGKYMRISGKQIPADNSVTSSSIVDGSIGPEKLSFEPLIGSWEHYSEQIKEEISENLENVKKFSRAHYVRCTNASSETNLIFKVDDFKDNYPATNPNRCVYSKTDLNGEVFYVMFTNAYSQTNSTPRITLKSATDNKVYWEDGGTQIAVENRGVYANDGVITKQYYWRAGSVITFVFDADNNRFNLVDTDALRTLGQWCYENDTTLINGGMIATGTVTAEQIRAGSISADKIAVGSLPLDVFENTVVKQFSDTVAASKQVNKMKTIYVTCETAGNEQYKEIVLTEDQAKILWDSDGRISQGAGMIVTFLYSNSSASPYLSVSGGSSFSNKSPINRINPDNPDEFTSDIGTLNWTSEITRENTRLFYYAAGKWIISSPTTSTLELAEWCRANNETYINGGLLITGKISADEIEANSITAKHIQAGSLSPALFNVDFDALYTPNKTIVGKCLTAQNTIAKIVELEDSAFDALMYTHTVIDDGIMSNTTYNIKVGASIVVKFTNKSPNVSTDKQWTLKLISKSGLYTSDYGIVNNDGTAISGKTVTESESWTENATMLFIFNGTSWVISKASSVMQAMAQYCEDNNQLYISGSSIVAGKIACTQLDSGTINSRDINIGYADGNIFRGIGDGRGSTNENDPNATTYGIKMFATTLYSGTDTKPADDPNCNYYFVTNGGLAMHNCVSNTKHSYLLMNSGNIIFKPQKDISIHINSDGFHEITSKSGTYNAPVGQMYIDLAVGTTQPATSTTITDIKDIGQLELVSVPVINSNGTALTGNKKYGWLYCTDDGTLKIIPKIPSVLYRQ